MWLRGLFICLLVYLLVYLFFFFREALKRAAGPDGSVRAEVLHRLINAVRGGH